MGCAESSHDISGDSVEVTNFAYTDDNSPPCKETVDIPVKDTQNITVNANAIAIVGIGCKTPGAENIRDFWRLLVNGENHIGDIPPTRWNADAFYDPDPMVPGKAYVKRAGFVQNPEEFDNTLFGINDFEYSSMDPQQRFVLECTHMALEDAGITSSQISGSKTGVYIGSMTSDYRSQFMAFTSHLDTYSATGISNCVLAARVSFLYNLLGPSMVVDTACSSSLIGMHLGCQSLLSGETDMAICGGVNYMASPDMFVHLSKARMISPTGQCHAFSADADGYTRGEGCGIVILKRLNDAVRDGDKVWATIVTGVNQDGHTVTPMTAPSAVQQKALLHQIYSKFQVDPSKVQYIEAHGTGTEAGDPVEANSLGTFFKEMSVPHTRYIGSVKTNIGHLESAAGVIGVIKVLLMMKHSTIVPSLHCQVINPKINLKDLYLSVPQTTLKWEQSEKVACCNSFGIGGTNTHVVLMEYKTSKQKNKVDEEPYYIVCFSACTKKSLKGIVEDVYHYENLLDLRLQDLSYTSTVRRNHYLYRLAIVSNSMHDLFNVTAGYLANDGTSMVPKRKPHVVFVFCGMATSWNGMCQQLMAEYPVFKSTMEEVNNLLLQFVTWSLIDRIYKEDPSTDPEFSPIAIFACQVSLAALWLSLGVSPSSVLGQSVGEVAAAYIAGCMSLADAVKIIYFRSKALAQVTGGRMILLKNMNVHAVKRFMEQYKGKACISLEYSPTSCAVSGDAISIETIRKDIMKQMKEKSHTVQIIDLPAPVAYHSQYVDPCKQQFAESLKGLKTNPPKIDFISSVTGMTHISAPDISYWIDNLRKPVLFNQAVQLSCKNKKQVVFLEIGPKPVLRSHLKDIFPDNNLSAVASMSKQPEQKIFLEAVSSMYEMGVDILWKNLPFRNAPQITDVPRYVFDKKRGLVKTETAALILGGLDLITNSHPYTFHLKSNEFKMVFSPLCSKFIFDHMVAGRIVIPGVVYVEAALAIAKHMYNGSPNPSQAVVSVQFQNLVSVQKDELVELMVRQVEGPASQNVPFLEFSVQKDKTLIASMQIYYMHVETYLLEIVSLEYIRSKCFVHVSKESIYAALGKLGFSYEKNFILLNSAQKNETEALVLLNVIPEVYKESKAMTIHPCILDCMIQTTVVFVKGDIKDKEQMLPKSVSGVKVYGKMEMSMLVHTILKAEKTTQIEYSITLLSLEGRVIAQIDTFIVSRLFVQNTENFTDLLCMKWSHIADICESDGLQTDYFSVILTDLKICGPLSNQNIVNIEDTGTSNAEWESLPNKVKIALQARNRLSVLVLVIHTPLDSDTDCDSLEARLVNMCGLIQRVLKDAIAASLSVPILICTFNACPINDGLIENECINPLATSLCGLIRALISENSYPRLLTVDMHMLPSVLTAQCLNNIIQTVLNNDDILSNGELIFKNNKLFSNKIARVDQNISVPVYRDLCPDFNNDVLMMSQEVDTIRNPVGIRHQGQLSHQASEEYIVIKANVFGIPPMELLKMKMPDDKRLDCNLHPVLALESVGEEVRHPGNQLISCCPVEVGTNVRVLESSTIPASVLPDYHLGDLTKLVVLWALSDKVSNPGVTILTSNTNKRLAEVLKLILTIQNNSRVVQIEMLESMTLAKSLNETMICLLYLDSHMMSFIASKWQNAHTLITCSFYMTKEAQSTLTYTLPQTEVCLVDSQLLFSHFSLNKIIPNLNIWLQNRKKDTLSTLVNLLHSETKIQMEDGVKTGPLHFSLQLQPVTMDNVQFKARRENLFTRNSVHIVVGGLTGLGWICVQYLVKNGAGNIVLLQRRQPSDEHIENINALESKFRCHIYVIQADVTSIGSLKKAFARIGQEIPNVPVKGIFFGAAVIRDGLFLDMQRSVFSEVVAPKIKGTWNLHLLTRHLPLDYFVMHSSVASVLGNAGQSNYCVGNSFMDGLAYYRRKLGMAAETINWGALDTGLLDNNTKARQKLESRGFLFMTQTDIEDKLDTMLMLNWPQTVAVKLSLERFSESLQGDNFTPLRMRLHGLVILSSRPRMETDNTEIQLAKRMEPTQRLQTCVKYVTRQICLILSADEFTVTPDVKLTDLGLDSISVQMMTTQIYKDTECQLPHVTFFAENATVRTVAETMSNMLVSPK